MTVPLLCLILLIDCSRTRSVLIRLLFRALLDMRASSQPVAKMSVIYDLIVSGMNEKAL